MECLENMRMDVNHKKSGFWTKYLFLTFVLILVLSSCSSEKSSALKEKKRFAMQAEHLSAEDKNFAMQAKHFTIQDENFIVEELNDSKVTSTFAQAINNSAREKNKRVSNYTVGKLKPYYYPDCTIFMRDDLIRSQQDEPVFRTTIASQVFYLAEQLDLGTLDTQFYFDVYMESLKEKNMRVIEHSHKLKKEISRDGVIYDVGYVRVDDNKSVSYTSLVMVPQKNLLLRHILIYNHVIPEKNSILEDMELLHRNIVFHKGNRDYVSGNTFLTDYHSKLILKQDGTYTFQRSKNDLMQGFHEGSYEVFYGEEAFKKLTSLRNYDITRDKLEEELEEDMLEGVSLEKELSTDYLSNREEKNKNAQEKGPKKHIICKDTFYAIILHDKNSATTKSKKEKKGDYTLYVGYYIEGEKALSLLNANSGSSEIWRLVKNTKKDD